MKRTSIREFDELLVALGVARNDSIFVHAFLPSFGVIEGGVKTVIHAMRERIGPKGNLIAPTFTASYQRGEIFDVADSVCFNGALSEGVRKLDGAIRSLCPLFSMAAIGGDAADLMERSNKNCFGKGSVYDHLFAQNVKFVGCGIDWDQGFSLFMHLERLAEIPFRREKTYHGETRLADGVLIKDEAVHFERREDISWRRKRGPFCEQLVEKGVIREVVRDGCAHRLVEAKAVGEITVKALKENPWVMAESTK